MARPRAFDEADMLARARDLFWEKGYTATSIQDLERHLGLNRSSIYSSLGDKATLYRKTLAAYRDDNHERIKEELGTTKNLRASLLAMLSTAAGAAVPEHCTGPRGCYIVNATTELASLDPEMLRFVMNNRERFTEIMAHALQQAQARGELGPTVNPEADAAYLFLLYNGLQVVVKTQPEPELLFQVIKRGINGLPWTD